MSKVLIESNEIDHLHKEIDRLNKVIEALIERTEEGTSTNTTDFNLFHATVNLEDQVRSRTQELEEALLKNEKITRALKQAKAQIERNEQHLHEITSSLGEGLLVLTSNGLLNFINKAACTMLGWTEEEILNKNVHDLFHPTREDGTPCSITTCPQLNVTKTHKLFSSEDDWYYRKDGTKFPISIIATPITLQDNTIGIAIAFHDTTDVRRERDWLRLMQAAIEHSSTSIVITDEKANIIYTNPQVTKTTGYSKEELYGRCTSIFQSGQASAKDYENLWKTILSGKVWKGELLDRRKDGSHFWEALSIAPVEDNHGVIKYFVGVSEDVTEKKKMHALLEEMSFHDALTGIANRRRFDEYFDLEWRQKSSTNKPLSIIMADVDFFKHYNDSLGHQAGDECLKRIAKALQSCIVRSGDMLARYGGEEFICILPKTDIAGAKLLAEKMRRSVLALKIPHPHSSTSEYVTISLGVAMSDDLSTNDFNKGNSLLEAADKALYHAKLHGRNCIGDASQLE